jgi:phage-related tail fiber protein
MPFYIDDILTDVSGVSLGARDPKESVRVATTANLSSLSGTQTIDGVAVIANDRVLVKNQSTGSANGIYVCAAGAWSRALDADSSAKITSGCRTYVEAGTVNAKTQWVLTTLNPIVLNTTALVFERDTEAGTGLTRELNTLSVSYGATGTTSCVGNDSRLSDDRTASGLRSATTVVAVASATAPSVGQVLTATANNAATWQTPTANNPTLTSSEATAASSATTSSSSDVLMTSMTLTPGAGNYLALFSGSLSHSALQDTYMSFYVNGVQVTASERRFSVVDIKQQGMICPVSMQAILASVSAGQAIEVKWKTTGATATVYKRALTLIKIG